MDNPEGGEENRVGWREPPFGNTPDTLRRLTLVAGVSNQGIDIDQAFSALMNERQTDTYTYVGILVATFMLSTAAFGFVCIATFAYIHRRIAASISTLADSVEHIRRGRTYLRVPEKRNDEVGALAAAINRLLDTQAQSLAKIDEQRQQIKQQAELLTVAGEIARVGGWSLMKDDAHVDWSDVVADIHGKPRGYRPTPEEAIGFYHDEDQPRIRKAFTACVERSLPYDLRAQIVDSEGNLHSVRTAGVPVRNGQGRVIGAHGALQDISKQMEVEQQLQRARRLESIGQLTGGIAHDFNNILTVILGNTELLVEEFDNDENLGALARMIRDSAERGAQLSHQLLAFARRQALNPQAVQLDQLLDGIHDMLDRSVGEAVTLLRDTEEDLWHCRLDTAQLENAVLNLVINARDAMPEGGTLTISTANCRIEADSNPPLQSMTSGDYVQLSISDTGEGIPAGDMERLFEPFFTTKPKGRGTGLGLPMVYGFVKQSAGYIDITSQPGQGTLVTLYFPRSRGKPVVKAPAGTPEESAQHASGSHRILLVEDDNLVRRYVEQQLHSLGYRVLSAAAGAEALHILREYEDIDLLFTDVVMPGGMSGRDLAELAARERPGLRVLYTSGYSQDVITHNGRVDDGIDLLRKPYRRGELARKLEHVLGDDPR